MEGRRSKGDGKALEKVDYSVQKDMNKNDRLLEDIEDFHVSEGT